ncbi:GNAT family N-acetyltransferase [Falsiruegeria litorea]|nr:GNAT family N-acetyltransferase [Falsiruegeria litorea]
MMVNKRMFDAPPTATSSALQQSPEFAATLRDIGRPPMVLDDQTLALHRRLPIGCRVAVLSRARVNINTLPGSIRRAGLHRTPLIINPEKPTPELSELGAVPLVSPASVADLNLTGDLHEPLHQKWRNRLSYAERQNLRVTRQNMPLDPKHWLFTATQAQQQTRRYKTWPVPLTLAYAQTNKGQAKLFTAFADTTPVAAVLILCHGDSATYHLGHTTARGRHHCAHNLLMWEAMVWLARKGHQRLDLGLISTEDSPGLARFKLGTGAQPRRLGGTWGWWPVLGRTLRPLAAMDTKLMAHS